MFYNYFNNNYFLYSCRRSLNTARPADVAAIIMVGVERSYENRNNITYSTKRHITVITTAAKTNVTTTTTTSNFVNRQKRQRTCCMKEINSNYSTSTSSTNNDNKLPESSTNWKFLSSPLKVDIIQVPFSGGQPKGGVELGPQALIENGLPNQLESLGWKVEVPDNNAELKAINDQFKSKGALDRHDKLKFPHYVGGMNESLKGWLNGSQSAGSFALTLGGDHSLAIGTIGATSQKFASEFCVVWVDAHADINTPETTISGNLHGCPVAFLLGLGSSNTVPGLEHSQSKLLTSRLVYIGLRDLDAGEKAILKKHGIKAFSMHEVDKYGIGKVVEMALDHVNPNRNLPIHLSFDVDALDPSVAPSTGTPVRGGLSFREGHFICEAICETGCLVAMDLVEVNPSLGDDASRLQTVQVGCSLVRCALGETLL